MLVGGVVSWRNAKQTLTVTSNVEAKFVSCFEATSHNLRVVDSISKSLKLYYDNWTAMFMTKNNISGSQSKQIDIKYLPIREHVKEKKVVIQHVKLRIVDPLTKGMPPKNFKDHVVQMRLGSILKHTIEFERIRVQNSRDNTSISKNIFSLQWLEKVQQCTQVDPHTDPHTAKALVWGSRPDRKAHGEDMRRSNRNAK
ncbi:hypothetical protein CR513_05508, partial [Mucuna pruriens]